MYRPIQHKNTTTPIVRNPINRPPLRHRLVLITLALFSFSAVCPTEARAECGATGDIPFTVTLLHPLPSNSVGCLYITGPWYRSSGANNLRDLPVGQPCTLYSADNTIFSPFGDWQITIATRCPAGVPTGIDSVAGRKFSLKQRNINRVNITVDPRGFDRYSITVSQNDTVEVFDATAEQSQVSSPKEVSVQAWLGDSKDAASGIPESDVFTFFGTAGDTVTVRLEADTKRGNNGGTATLRFGNRQVTGTLPQTITVQLASTGKNQIAVEQPSGAGEADYRGAYILRAESAGGKIGTLTPALSVEK